MITDLSPLQRRVRWVGLLAGPILALITYFTITRNSTPVGESLSLHGALSPAGRATLAVMVWMAVWWLTEAIDISATALLPLALFPIFGVATIKAAAAPFASPVIYLFFGGFLIAVTMQRWGLDRRLALGILRVVGSSPARMVGGFMLATATLSAFVSNTATTAMMLPIAISIITLLDNPPTVSEGETDLPGAGPDDRKRFAVCLMLAIAYAASIGGMATIIGTPPNGILVEFLRENVGIDISFAQWLKVGVPIAVIFLPVTWFLLTRLLYPVHRVKFQSGSDFLHKEYQKLGPMKGGEWASLIVFLTAAFLWIFRPLLTTIHFGTGDQIIAPFSGLSDGGIAVIAGLALFVIPINIRKHIFALDWKTARTIPWGILVLFGGGLSLAAAVKTNGVAEFFGSQTNIIQGSHSIFILISVITFVVFLTELTSNTATTATLLPILAAVAPSLNTSPAMLCIAAALSASCAFMMPVATPPNAIVFGSGRVTIGQMCHAGIWLNIAAIAIITSFMYYALGFFFPPATLMIPAP